MGLVLLGIHEAVVFVAGDNFGGIDKVGKEDADSVVVFMLQDVGEKAIYGLFMRSAGGVDVLDGDFLVTGDFGIDWEI